MEEGIEKRASDSGNLTAALAAKELHVLYISPLSAKNVYRVLGDKFGTKIVQEAIIEKGRFNKQFYVTGWISVSIDSNKHKEVILAALASKF